MFVKSLVPIESAEAEAVVRGTGVEVIARYPDSVLVRGSDEQNRAIEAAGLDVVPIGERPVLVTGNSFAFDDAVLAQEAVEVRPPAGRTAYYLLRLVGPAAPQWLRDLRAAGAEVHDSLAGAALLVGVPPERAEGLRELPWVEDVTPYRPTMKVSPRLRVGGRDVGVAELAALDVEGGEDLVEVSVFAGEDVREVVARVHSSGGTVLSTTERTVVAHVDPSELADLPGVQSVLPHALPELSNDRARLVLRVPNGAPGAVRELTGAGQVVAIADSGLDTGDPATVHPDLHGRVEGIVSWPTSTSLAAFLNDPPGSDDGPADLDSGHGTHVAGSVLGNGQAAIAAGATAVPKGVAPGAKVHFQAISQRSDWKTAEQLAADGLTPFARPWPPSAVGLRGLPDDLSSLFREAYAAGARIHTNSWGAKAGTGAYTANAAAVDEFTWRFPDMLILFSAGNEGEDVDQDGVVDAASLTSPGTAKNCLTVGATENDRPANSEPKPGVDAGWDRFGFPRLKAGHVSDDIDGMAAFSSRGPTDDGRIKPDVVAPGTNVLSTLSSVLPPEARPLWGRLPEANPLHVHYVWSGGTSMATPLVAGAAALIRQHLVRDRGHRTPSAALVKAFLVNGAVPLKGQFEGEVPAGANNVSGFGRVDVGRSVAPDPHHLTLFADGPTTAVTTGEVKAYQVDHVDPAMPLRVTLVWTDAPSQPGSGGLVNELYLQVRKPDGTVLHGDVHPFPRATNNVQRVVIDTPEAGTYLVRVWGVSVVAAPPSQPRDADPRQPFALAVSNGDALT
jgi:serine protease AprX